MMQGNGLGAVGNGLFKEAYQLLFLHLPHQVTGFRRMGKLGYWKTAAPLG
jgi:hypothetical protein